jgi:hypothetical protein
MMPRPRLQEEFAYQPPVLKKVASPAEKFLQAVLVAVVGTGLGIGVGVFLAGRTLPGDASAAVSPTPANTTQSTAPSISTQATIKTGPVAPAPSDASTGKQPTLAATTRVALPSAASQLGQARVVRASLKGLRTRHHRHGLRHRGALAALMFPKPKAPSLIEEAKLEIPDGRFRFTIEGDQTAVSYDVQSGVVSTDGSGLFVVEKAPGEPPVFRPQATPSNVHYKCDQDANCSLIMASIVVPHARLRTVSRTTDWAYVPTDTRAHDATQAPVYFGHVSR